MAPSARSTALKDLQSQLDAGEITRADFNQRRKRIVDSAIAKKPQAAVAPPLTPSRSELQPPTRSARGFLDQPRDVWRFESPLPDDRFAPIDPAGPFGMAARGVEVRPCAVKANGLGVFNLRVLHRGDLVGLYQGERLTSNQYWARHGAPRDENGVHITSETAWRRHGGTRGGGSMSALVDRATAVERQNRLDALTSGAPMGGANNQGSYVFQLPSSAIDIVDGEPVHCVDAEDPNRSSWCRYLNHAPKSSAKCNVQPKVDATGAIWFEICAVRVEVGTELCFDYGPNFEHLNVTNTDENVIDDSTCGATPESQLALVMERRAARKAQERREAEERWLCKSPPVAPPTVASRQASGPGPEAPGPEASTAVPVTWF